MQKHKVVGQYAAEQLHFPDSNWRKGLKGAYGRAEDQLQTWLQSHSHVIP